MKNTKNYTRTTLEESIKISLEKYIKLVNRYQNLDDCFICEGFEDRIYYDSSGYSDFYNNIEDREIRELYDAHFDLSNKVYKLQNILKNIKENQKLMNSFRAEFA